MSSFTHSFELLFFLLLKGKNLQLSVLGEGLIKLLIKFERLVIFCNPNSEKVGVWRQKRARKLKSGTQADIYQKEKKERRKSMPFIVYAQLWLWGE